MVFNDHNLVEAVYTFVGEEYIQYDAMLSDGKQPLTGVDCVRISKNKKALDFSRAFCGTDRDRTGDLRLDRPAF